MSRRTNSWLVRCTSLLAVLALGALPVVFAAGPSIEPAKDLVKKHPMTVASLAPESAPLSNELYHNDLGTGFRVAWSIPPTQTTALHGDKVFLQDYGAGLEIRQINYFVCTEAQIPGKCVGGDNDGQACTSGECPGGTNTCTASGGPCSSNGDCPQYNGNEYDYCDSCVFDEFWLSRFRIYDNYDAGLSPVNSGLLGSSTYNSGGDWPLGSCFGRVDNFAPGFIVADPDIFYTIEQKNLARNPGDPRVPTDAEVDAAGWTVGSWNFRGGGNPERGSTDTGSYIDQDSNAVLDAADYFPGFNSATCASQGGVCQANLRLFIRGPRNPALIDPGADFYTIAGNGDSYVDLALGAGTFDFDDSGFVDCTGGLGSSVDLNQHVVLSGREVKSSLTIGGNPASLPYLHAITEHAALLLPGSTSFNLVSFFAGPKGNAPVLVTRDDGSGNLSTEEWDLSVCKNSGASGGTHTASRNSCPPTATAFGQGGPLEMTLNLRPKLTFTKRSDPTCVVTIDTGLPVPMTSGPNPFKWNDLPADSQVLLPSGASYDKTCDAVVDTPPAVGGNSNFPGFHAGTFIPRCPSDLSCDEDPAVTRLWRLTGPYWGVAFHQIVATVDLQEATDTDDDGVLNGADDCDDVYDPDQADSDGDGVGDACDNSPNCNPGQDDSDGDGTPDVDDGCPNDPNKTDPGVCGCGVADTDGDGDGVADCNDNCPNDANADQADSDGNGIGDVCDGCQDADDDGLCDEDDACPGSCLDPTVIIPPSCTPPPPPGTAPNTALPCDSGVPNYLLADGCTLEDKIAACIASSSSQGQFDKCVKALLNQWKKDHIITEKQKKAIDKCVKKYKKRSTQFQSAGSSIGGAGDH